MDKEAALFFNRIQDAILQRWEYIPFSVRRRAVQAAETEIQTWLIDQEEWIARHG